MKKIVITLSALVLGFTAMAQLNIGAKAGLNYTIVNTMIDPEPDESPESASGIGFHLGGYLQYNFSDMLGIRPELLYSARGFQEDQSSTTSYDVFGTTYTTETTSDNKSTYSYLEIPILLAIQPSEKFAIHVGPGFGMLMGGKVKSSGETTTTTTSGGSTTTSTTSFDEEYSGSDVTDGLNKLEIAAVVGLGYQLESGLGFNLRYWRGLNTLNEETEPFPGIEVKQNTNLIQFSVTFALVKD